MGWFDSKSWKLRRKIKDLQADLRKAEREGLYVVEQGIFFAKLEEMSDQTMMVLGTTDVLDSQEESVIRTFFDRNGFTVERVRFDRAHTHLAEIEIIPPTEVVKLVGRRLKSAGYRVLDDTENERRAELDRFIFPLSSLMRGITTLFAERVQEIISTTHIKMNKEGNRLLHWMPRIIEAMQEKISRGIVDLVREPFEEAFRQHYGQIEHAIPQTPDPPAPEPVVAVSPPPPMLSQPEMAEAMQREAAQAVEPFRPYRATPGPQPEAEPVPSVEYQKMVAERDLAETKARMYKSLVKTTEARCVRNAEVLLGYINKLLEASASCVMVKVSPGRGLTIHAQAGRKLVWGESGDETRSPVSATVVGNCVRRRQLVTSDLDSAGQAASMPFHRLEATAAVPIVVQDEIVAILYVDRRSTMRAFSETDCRTLVSLAEVFQDFAGLTLSLAR